MRSIKEDLTLRRLDGARSDAPRCLKGKPCGDRCIPRDQECHEGGTSPLKEFDNRFKKLSRTEKLAIGGVGAVALGNAVALPLLVRPTGRAIVEGAGEALGKNRKGVDDFIAKQSTTAASNAATSASETFNRLNKEGAFNETYQNLGSNIVEGGLSEKNINAAMRNIQNAANEGILSEKNINQTLRNLQKAGNRRVEVQRRLNRRVASRDTKRVQQAMSSLEPQFAKTFKKRLGIKSDSLPPLKDLIRSDACPPGQKQCGSGCIPAGSNCPTGGIGAGGLAAAAGLGGAAVYGAPKAIEQGKRAYKKYQLSQKRKNRKLNSNKPAASPAPAAPARTPRSPGTIRTSQQRPGTISAQRNRPRKVSVTPVTPQRALPPARSPQLALPPARSPQTPARRKPLVTPAPSNSGRTLVTPAPKPTIQRKRASLRSSLRSAVSRRANAVRSGIQGRVQSTQRSLNRAGRRAQIGAVRQGRQLKELLTYQNPAKQRLNRMRIGKAQRAVGAAGSRTIGSIQAAGSSIRNRMGAGIQSGRSSLRTSRRNLKAGAIKALRRF